MASISYADVVAATLRKIEPQIYARISDSTIKKWIASGRDAKVVVPSKCGHMCYYPLSEWCCTCRASGYYCEICTKRDELEGVERG